MAIDERAQKFREAIWTFTTNVLPKVSPELQPSLADIAWLIVNHFFSPEDGEELYLKFQKIWGRQSVKSNYHIELLTHCAWKVRLYLTYNQPENAFRLFQQITKTILHKGTTLGAELGNVCLPTSLNFPYPKILEKDISLLIGIGELCEQINGNLTLRKISKQVKLPLEELIKQLQKIKMVFGSMVAFEALGLYWLRAEVEINSHYSLQHLIDKFKSLAYRCDAYSSLRKSSKVNENDVERLSVEFAYPITQKKDLFEWAHENQIILFRKIRERVYQNFNVLYKEQWSPMDVTRARHGFITSFKYDINKIRLTKRIFQIIKTYQRSISFTKGKKLDEVNCLLPFYKLGLHLKTNVTGLHQEATDLFQKRILVPYFYSELLGYTPEKIVEGDESLLHNEARSYLYARAETLLSFNEEKKTWGDKIFRLFVPEISPNLLELYRFRTVKRVYFNLSKYFIKKDKYNMENSCWCFPKLSEICLL